MVFKKVSDVYFVRLKKDELLIEELSGLVRRENIQLGWVQAIGGVQWAELGFYDLESQQYNWQRIDRPMEITGLSGNISWQEAYPILHFHGTFSDTQFRSVGGHVKEAMIAGTCEVFIRAIEGMHVNRSHDNAVGLNLLG